MKRKFLIGLLVASSCFALGSTSFADSAVKQSYDTNSAVSSTLAASKIVTPNAMRYERHAVSYNKSYYPLSSDVPSTYFYSNGGYSGILSLTTLTSSSTSQDGWWTAIYEGYVSN